MTEITISTPSQMTAEIRKLYTQASAWHPLAVFQQSVHAHKSPDNEQFKVALHNFNVDYGTEHRGLEGVENTECAVIETASDIEAQQIYKALDAQANAVARLVYYNDQSPSARQISHYWETKHVTHKREDVDGNTLLQHRVYKLPIEGDDKHSYMVIFINSEMRALVAAHLLQQGKRHGAV